MNYSTVYVLYFIHDFHHSGGMNKGVHEESIAEVNRYFFMFFPPVFSFLRNIIRWWRTEFAGFGIKCKYATFPALVYAGILVKYSAKV